jgi:hypothetical protein
MRPSALCCLLLTALCGCFTKQPVLYPNPQLEAAGREEAERAVDACQAAAREFQPQGTAEEQAAGETAASAGAGAAAGAVGGAIGGRGAGRGAAIGAASGATYGVFRAIFRRRDPDPVRKRFVERCLTEGGYEVAGWR